MNRTINLLIIIVTLFGVNVENSEAANLIQNVDGVVVNVKKSNWYCIGPFKDEEFGRLMGWAKPFVEQDIGHKDASHLWGLLEGNQIVPSEIPELAIAARKSLDLRVDYGMAKTPVFRAMAAWVMSGYNWLWDANEAYKYLKYTLGKSSKSNLMAISYQGMNRKIWETEANFGLTSCITEMFLQSHAGFVYILPALQTS